jgi:hypothetical protein
MHRLRAPRSLTALVLGLALAACQTTGPAPTSHAATPEAPSKLEPVLPETPGRIVAQNKGWVVRAHPARDGTEAYCLATPSGEALPRLAFRATAEEAAMLVRGGDSAKPGEDEAKLTATFQDGEKLALDARPMADGRVLVPVEIPQYYDVLDPFAASKSVTLESELLGKPVADLNLSGSLWAINALDECRILHTEK